MTEPENFLSRWSRRKQEAERDSDAQDNEQSVERVPAIEPDASKAGTEPPGTESPGTESPGTESPRAEAPGAKASGIEAKTEGQQEASVDLSSLPPIESINAGTDVGPFLRKGVPLELTRAALRRAWTTDPTIRDFIGIAENQWDFATGSDLPGFGPLEASDDVRRMVEELFQQKLPATEAAPSALSPLQAEEGARTALNEADLAADAQSTAVPNSPSSAPPESEPQVSKADNKEVNIATQQTRQQSDSDLPAKRTHGRALPQ
jgi:hypothetical protein